MPPFQGFKPLHNHEQETSQVQPWDMPVPPRASSSCMTIERSAPGFAESNPDLKSIPFKTQMMTCDFTQKKEKETRRPHVVQFPLSLCRLDPFDNNTLFLL
jgi:hypothetical protein